MRRFTLRTRAAAAPLAALGALSAAACSSYPDAPRYSTRPMPTGAAAYPAPGAGPAYAPPPSAYEPPPPARAPIGEIEGGSLPPPAAGGYGPPATSTRPIGAAGSIAYAIQAGDTISGVGRRFQTPVQTLIDLNGLGPRGTISAGQRIILPETAVDTGPDPYAAGPAPVGVMVSNAGTPPPPPPPSGGSALPPPSRQPAWSSPGAAAPPAAGIALDWPVRGDIVRRFGPVGLGERNNGVNIGAPAGRPVRAAADGQVAYVGDLVGQGLTVLIAHRDGWRTVYGHLGSTTVDDGEEVRGGQQIGTVGVTAGDGRPSIHFETRRMQGDEPVAIDPLTVLPR